MFNFQWNVRKKLYSRYDCKEEILIFKSWKIFFNIFTDVSGLTMDLIFEKNKLGTAKVEALRFENETK